MKRITAAAAILLCSLPLGTHAIGGTITITNCTTSKAWIGAYNSNDELLMFAASDACLAAGDRKTFTCATSSCKLMSTGNSCFPTREGVTKPASGTWVLYNGQLLSRSTCP